MSPQAMLRIAEKAKLFSQEFGVKSNFAITERELVLDMEI